MVHQGVQARQRLMQYTEFFFSAVKNEIFVEFFFFIYFDMYAQIIDFGNTLEPPPRRGGSNEYPESMF